jgi:hypothetical protein
MSEQPAFRAADYGPGADGIRAASTAALGWAKENGAGYVEVDVTAMTEHCGCCGDHRGRMIHCSLHCPEAGGSWGSVSQ